MKTPSIGYISDAKIDSLFSSTGMFQQDQLDNLAKKALQNGIDAYTKGDYDKAVKEFKRSIGLSPYSDYSIEIHHYAADAYLKMNKVGDAINIYKQAIRLFPSDDSSHLNLGTVYYSHGRYREAEEEYELAVRINPSSPVNRYALGQTYLTNGDYTNAEIQVKMVRQLSPQDPNAYDALGQVYRNIGKYDDAVLCFKRQLP